MTFNSRAHQCFPGKASSTAPKPIDEKKAALEQKRAMLLETLHTLHYSELFFFYLFSFCQLASYITHALSKLRLPHLQSVSTIHWHPTHSKQAQDPAQEERACRASQGHSTPSWFAGPASFGTRLWRFKNPKIISGGFRGIWN